MKKRKSSKTYGYSKRSRDVHVTQAMLYGVRDELKSDIVRVEHRISSVELNLKSEIARLESQIANVSSQVHRILVLTEEQNARNIAVMDGLAFLFHRQDRVEEKLDHVEKTIADFKK